MKRNEQGARGGARRPGEWSAMTECAANLRPGIMSSFGSWFVVPRTWLGEALELSNP